ncbi:hypothetical protein A2704_04640 [Candidatus Kaiserbacteria bacterium RIFCSPHIGHO2_01_FULL_54_36b]|uniref:Gfo/Idh/MocA-like oxidoreductase N-terminal domain-containing protein n=2 Tax=Parcubacteria group TaxID=1794811 RepID=A0A1F6CQK5_9BACT|nr:MAG: hypothetical protein A2704_04640 [Candidatus Kaiserbacteria bacterium RIFCSPHIGHO2_01_FULL_54_36b]
MSEVSNNKVPRIMLVGVGRFGRHHLRVLKMLADQGQIILEGAVVKTPEKQARIANEFQVPVFTEIPIALLQKVDGVVVATPMDTHFSIVNTCLEYANVLVEKPLAMNTADAKLLESKARQRNRVLMVAHTYRFHPMVEKLQSLLGTEDGLPYRIEGQFVNPANTDSNENPSLDHLHFFDVIDFLFKKTPLSVHCNASGRAHTVSLRYPENMDAILKLGWNGDAKKRTLEFFYRDKSIRCDFIQNTIDVICGGENRRIEVNSTVEPLEKELRLYIQLLQGNAAPEHYPDAVVGSRILDVALKAQPLQTEHKPRVAIIGGGIFGANCAIKLAAFCDVTMFERNNDILGEASFVNQYRHHWGYHYPRSAETVRDIQRAMESFESLYQSAIVRNFPTYYGVAKDGSKVSAEDYVRFCREHNLPFTLEYPDPRYLDPNQVSVCLKTMEPIYDYTRLKSLVHSYLTQEKNIHIELGSNVIGGQLLADGRKELLVQSNGNSSARTFDFIINATYANHNTFPDWFGFPKKEVRIDLVEALIVRLPIPHISLAVMDGPFTNLVPTGENGVFTLVHIKESILKRFVPSDGLVPPGLQVSSNAKKIVEKSKEWFPILEQAELLESRYVFRCVNANREHDDARPSDITRHGFGCFSILGGKILNSVRVAQELAEEIRGYTSTPSAATPVALVNGFAQPSADLNVRRSLMDPPDRPQIVEDPQAIR